MTDTDGLSQPLRAPLALAGLARTAELTSDRPCNDLSRLLGFRGIGPTVVQRLTAVGVRSIADLQRRGVDSTVNDVCKHTGQAGWRNRSCALAGALAELNKASAQGT
jgi:hypothetical protein